jgi:hypothetical protein
MGFAAKRKHELTAQEALDHLETLHLAPADLRRLIELTQAFISDDLQRMVKEQKASAAGRDLPEQMLTFDLRKHGCPCLCAMRWLGNG